MSKTLEKVSKALEFEKSVKVEDLLSICSKKNYACRCQLEELIDFVERRSDKDDYYVNEGGVYEILSSSKQPMLSLFTGEFILKFYA